MTNIVKIIHLESEETLFQCSMSEIDQAYKRFSEYEEMGLEVKLIVPSTAETVINLLNIPEDQKENFRKTLAEEIDSHNDSCCYTSSDQD